MSVEAEKFFNVLGKFYASDAPGHALVVELEGGHYLPIFSDWNKIVHFFGGTSAPLVTPVQITDAREFDKEVKMTRWKVLLDPERTEDGTVKGYVVELDVESN